MTVDELISALQDLKFEWADSGYVLGEVAVFTDDGCNQRLPEKIQFKNGYVFIDLGRIV